MNILSLFDGISCGQIALQRAGVRVDSYYASEVCPHAIKVTQHNFPNTIQLGDVRNVKSSDLPKIDLLIGGSPCQGFSFAGKVLNFEDPRSKLFFEFARLKKELNPKYFLLENVRMGQVHQDVISEILGVKPIGIDSALLSAQTRKRLYWTNIPIDKISDKGIHLSSVLETTQDWKPAAVRGRYVEGRTKQFLEVKTLNTDKSNCLTTVSKGNVLTPSCSGLASQTLYRPYSPIEYERLQTLTDNYTSILSDYQRRKAIGNAWTVDIITHIFKRLQDAAGQE